MVQADTFLDDPATVTVCLISTAVEARTFRIPVSPLPDNGLSEASTVLVDKLLTLRESSVDRVIGTLDPASLRRVDEALRMWLAL